MKLIPGIIISLILLVIMIATGCDNIINTVIDAKENQLQCSDNAGGKICYDPVTGLTWKRCSELSTENDSCSYNSSPGSYNYCDSNDDTCETNKVLNGTASSQAYTVCNNNALSSYGGKSSWRVATIDELDNFYDRFRAIYKSYNVAFAKTGYDVWSATAYSGSTNTAYYLTSSGTQGTQTKTSDDDVRCVSD
ncbi:MAG: DUF1566 domain-containing protein [bacterium]|nr:DUF1566 domain-containing protein [bacterium]